MRKVVNGFRICYRGHRMTAENSRPQAKKNRTYFVCRKCDKKSRRSGVAALEFAFVLPILLLITFGLIDLGRALYTVAALDYTSQIFARCQAIGREDCHAETLPGLAFATYKTTQTASCLEVQGKMDLRTFSPFFPTLHLEETSCFPT